MTARLVSPPNGAVLITSTDGTNLQEIRAGGAAVTGEVVAFCVNVSTAWCWVELHVASKIRFRVNVPPNQTIPAWVGPVGQNDAIAAYAQTASVVNVILQARPQASGGAGGLLTDDAILDVIAETRAAADRGKPIGVSPTNENQLAFLDKISFNPTEAATRLLTKLGLEAVVYRLGVSWNDVTDKPSIPDVGANPQGNPTGTLTKLLLGATVYKLGAAWADITGKPNFFSGNYNDLTNKPTIPSVPARAGAFTAALQQQLEAAFDGVWDNAVSRTFISAAQSENTYGEARYTEPTGVAQDRELYIDYKDSDGVDRNEWLTDVGVNDWLYLVKGSNSLLFKVEAVQTSDSAGKQFLFTAANAMVVGSWPSDASLTGDFTLYATDADLAAYAKTDLSNLGTLANSAVTLLANTFARRSLSNVQSITTGAAEKIRDAVRSVIDAAFKAAVQGSNEDESLGTFQRVGAGQASGGDDRFSYSSPTLTLSVAADSSYQSASSETNDGKLWRALKERAWIKFGNGWEIEITALTDRYLSQGRAQYQVDSFTTLRGSIVGLNGNTSVTIIGEDVHRGQLTEASFRENAPSLSHQYVRSTGGATPDAQLEAPLTTLGSSTTEKKMAMAGAVRAAITAATPQSGQIQEIRTYALGTDWTIVPSTNSAATGQEITITPRSSSSRFQFRCAVHMGSLNNQTRVDLRLARKIGTGSWVGIQDKTYALYTGSTYNGAMDLTWGPYEDAPATSEAVSYRLQLKRVGTSAGNIESAFVEVVEIL